MVDVENNKDFFLFFIFCGSQQRLVVGFLSCFLRAKNKNTIIIIVDINYNKDKFWFKHVQRYLFNLLDDKVYVWTLFKIMRF